MQKLFNRRVICLLSDHQPINQLTFNLLLLQPTVDNTIFKIGTRYWIQFRESFIDNNKLSELDATINYQFKSNNRLIVKGTLPTENQQYLIMLEPQDEINLEYMNFISHLDKVIIFCKSSQVEKIINHGLIFEIVEYSYLTYPNKFANAFASNKINLQNWLLSMTYLRSYNRIKVKELHSPLILANVKTIEFGNHIVFSNKKFIREHLHENSNNIDNIENIAELINQSKALQQDLDQFCAINCVDLHLNNSYGAYLANYFANFEMVESSLNNLSKLK